MFGFKLGAVQHALTDLFQSLRSSTGVRRRLVEHEITATGGCFGAKASYMDSPHSRAFPDSQRKNTSGCRFPPPPPQMVVLEPHKFGYPQKKILPRVLVWIVQSWAGAGPCWSFVCCNVGLELGSVSASSWRLSSGNSWFYSQRLAFPFRQKGLRRATYVHKRKFVSAWHVREGFMAHLHVSPDEMPGTQRVGFVASGPVIRVLQRGISMRCFAPESWSRVTTRSWKTTRTPGLSVVCPGLGVMSCRAWVHVIKDASFFLERVWEKGGSQVECRRAKSRTEGAAARVASCMAVHSQVWHPRCGDKEDGEQAVRKDGQQAHDV